MSVLLQFACIKRYIVIYANKDFNKDSNKGINNEVQQNNNQLEVDKKKRVPRTTKSSLEQKMNLIIISQ